MRALILDPFAGIGGDMLLAALLDLGPGEAWLRRFTESLTIPAVSPRVDTVDRRGIACKRVSFDIPEETVHRHLPEILGIIEESGVDGEVRAESERAFRLLAEAEGSVHGIPAEQVHFHEVGGLDAILDILCSLAAVRELGVERCYTRPVALGSGWVEIAHGRYPIPAPATARLLAGIEVIETGIVGECTTPTGAVLLSVLTGGSAPPATYRILDSGMGAGSRDPETHPNCLRILLAEVDSEAEALYLLQSDVDDLAPEYAPAAQEAMLAAGAVDCVLLGVGMKKGRPGLRFEALVPTGYLDAVLSALFRFTTTIGARFWPVERPSLPRWEEVADWSGQRVRVKGVRLPDGSERRKPEYEDVMDAARATGHAPLEVRRAIDGLDPATRGGD